MWVIRRSLHIDKNQKIKFHSYNKIVVPLFGAAYAARNKGTIILYWFTKTYILSNGR